jgi:hypothetical protein
MHFNSHNSIVGVCEVGGCDDDFAKNAFFPLMLNFMFLEFMSVCRL